MRRVTLSLYLFAVSLAAHAGEAAKIQSPKDVLQAWARSLTVGEVEDTLAFYEDSDRVVAIESMGRVRPGRKEIRAMYEEAFDEVIFERVVLRLRQVRRKAETAWATGRFLAATRVKEDGTRLTLEVRCSFVLIRSGEKWRIVLEHFSPIAGVPRVRRRGLGTVRPELMGQVDLVGSFLVEITSGAAV